MNSVLKFQGIGFGGAVVALMIILVYNLWKKMMIRRNSYMMSTPKERRAPEPAGAWPIIGHLPLLGGKDPVARTLGTMADKYGPTFMIRLGEHRALVVSSWETVKDCFTTNDRVLASRPLGAAGKYMGYNYAMFGFSPYGPYWRETRKIATLELLSNTRLEMLRHLRIQEVDDCIKNLHSLCCGAGAGAGAGAGPVRVEMKQWFEMLTFNVITKMIAGKRYFGAVAPGEVEEARRFRKTIKQFMYLLGVFTLSDALPYLEWMDLQGHIRSMKHTEKEMDGIMVSWVEEHRRKRLSGELDGKQDFIDVMLSKIPEDDSDSDIIIKSTASAIIIAASDTTSITLTWALSLILINPHVLKRVQDELDIQVGKDRQVEEADVRKLVYLQAVVKETMRLYPAAPLSVPHEAMEDCYIGGYHVPKGSRLLVNIWKLHRDSRVWSDPLEFQPERFLTSHTNMDVRGQQHEYIPFSSGRRACPGITFGLQVLHLTLARLLQGFNLTTPSDEAVDMSESLGITLPKAMPLEVLLSPRLHPELY